MKDKPVYNKRSGKIKYLCIICAFLSALTVFGSNGYNDGENMAVVSAADEESQLVRVGLEAIYYNKQTIIP